MMSRRDEFLNGLNKTNRNGGVSADEWQMFLLTDITLSLATIADALEEQNKLSKDGLRVNKETSERMISDNDKYYKWMKSFAKGEAND